MRTIILFCGLVLATAVWGEIGAESAVYAANPAGNGGLNLFEARDQGQLAMRFVPASEKNGTLTLNNRTRAPLAIRIPDTLGAVPVLAQFQPQPQPQVLGLAFPAIGEGGSAFRGVVWRGNRPERVVQLPARGTVRIALIGVCLEYGKPTPNSAMRYELVPVEKVVSDAKLAAALQSMADGRHKQQAVQAVAWHLANGLTWKRLRGKFSAREYHAAQQLLQEVSAPGDAPVTPAPQSNISPAEKSA